MASPIFETKLLLHLNGSNGDTTTIDDSQHEHSLTFQSNAELSTIEKQFGTSSLLLDGVSGYITSPDSSDWELGSDSFTIDWWEYRTSFTEASTVLARDETNLYPAFILGTADNFQNAVYVKFHNTTAWDVGEYQLGSKLLNQWVHYAVTRDGNTFYTFQNGIQISTWTSALSLNASSASLSIGKYNAGIFFGGYIDELRVVKGEALYISNFTPPVSEYIVGVQQGRNIELRADTGFIVNEKVNLIYNIYDKVNNAVNFLYDNGFIVNNDLEYIYKSTESVNRSLQFLYDNGLLVNKDLNILFNSASFVNKDLPLRYFIEKIVTKDIAFLFDVGKNVSNDIELKYSLSSFVTKDSNFPYRIGALVNNALEFIYDSGAFVNNNVTFTYGTADIVNNDLDLSYNLKSFVNNSLEWISGIRWDVRRQFRTLNNIYAVINRDLEYLSNIYAVINKDLRFIYNNSGAGVDDSIVSIYLNLSLAQKATLNLHRKLVNIKCSTKTEQIFVHKTLKNLSLLSDKLLKINLVP